MLKDAIEHEPETEYVYEDEDAPGAPLTIDEACAFFDPLTDEEAFGIARRALHYRAEIDAITANAKALVEEQQRKLDTLFAEEGERIRGWITARKPNARSRRTIYGLLGMRKSGGTLTIVDEELALASVRELAPSALREVVDKAKLPPNFTAPGFDQTPEVNKFYVEPTPRRKGTAEEE